MSRLTPSVNALILTIAFLVVVAALPLTLAHHAKLPVNEEQQIDAIVITYLLLALFAAIVAHRLEVREYVWLQGRRPLDEAALDRCITTTDQTYATAANVLIGAGMITSAGTIVFISMATSGNMTEFLRLAPRAVAATALGLASALVFVIRGQSRANAMKQAFQDAVEAASLPCATETRVGMPVDLSESVRSFASAVNVFADSMGFRLPSIGANAEVGLTSAVEMFSQLAERLVTSASVLYTSAEVRSGEISNSFREFTKSANEREERFERHITDTSIALQSVISTALVRIEQNTTSLNTLGATVADSVRDLDDTRKSIGKLCLAIDTFAGATPDMVGAAKQLASSMAIAAIAASRASNDVLVGVEKAARAMDQWAGEVVGSTTSLASLNRECAANISNSILDGIVALDRAFGVVANASNEIAILAKTTGELRSASIPMIVTALDTVAEGQRLSLDQSVTSAASFGQLTSDAVEAMNNLAGTVKSAADAGLSSASEAHADSEHVTAMMRQSASEVVTGIAAAAVAVADLVGQISRSTLRNLDALDRTATALGQATGQIDIIAKTVESLSSVVIPKSIAALESVAHGQFAIVRQSDLSISALTGATRSAVELGVVIEALGTTLSREQGGLIAKHTEFLRDRAAALMEETFTIVTTRVNRDLEDVAARLQQHARAAYERAFDTAAGRLDQVLGSTVDRTNAVSTNLEKVNHGLDSIASELYSLDKALAASAAATGETIATFSESANRMMAAATVLLHSVVAPENESSAVAGMLDSLHAAAEELHEAASAVRTTFEDMATERLLIQQLRTEMSSLAVEARLLRLRHVTPT